VGVLALQSEASSTPSPLDVLGAETEGMIGYLIEQALGNRLAGRPVATVLTQVLVSAADPAFGAPTKPIGPIYTEAEARRLAGERGWAVAPDGTSFRRVVASPKPIEIVELSTIRLLLDAGVTVVCAGGGGVPVVADADGSLHGVEAVIDKDLSAALLAERLGASMLVMLTDVATVERDWGTPAAQPIRTIDPAGLRALRFAAGSMGPKVDAACRFVEATGGIAAIGSLAEAEAVVRGESGTRVVPSAEGPAAIAV
jgi:carbamate kinase